MLFSRFSVCSAGILEKQETQARASLDNHENIRQKKYANRLNQKANRAWSTQLDIIGK